MKLEVPVTQPLFLGELTHSTFMHLRLCAIYHIKCLRYKHGFAGSLAQSIPESGQTGYGIH